MTAAISGRSRARRASRSIIEATVRSWVGDRRRVAHVSPELEAPGVKLAPLALEQRAQLEEEARRNDAVACEDRADAARTRAFRYLHDHRAAASPGERLKQRDEKPGHGG